MYNNKKIVVDYRN
uniref:Uncharacterized protein n=1 Tax=Leuconostoc citreum TaxID=33964 RepID=A0A098DPH6_LEUCI|nr:Protein of unknown function [Leuconostoc citreum]